MPSSAFDNIGLRAVIGIACVALLGALSVAYNTRRACAVQDTPYLPLCDEQADPVARLRDRIAANPGDTRAYVALAGARSPAANASAVQAALLVAPTHPQVQKLRAAASLQRDNVSDAIGPLVDLAEYNANEAAALALARLVVAGQGALLEPHLRPGTNWVGRMLQQLPNARGSISSALPLVGLALDRGALQPAAVASYIEQLKAAQSWTDAYALWLTLHRKPLPMLYNGSFDQPFVSNGFDWEVNMPGPRGRVGAVVDRSGAENRGAVLDIQFTGRSIALPMARQYVFVGPGLHKLHGEYRTNRQLRIDQGLAWAVRCTEGARVVAGRSASLGNTDNAWTPFDFEFIVPPGCGNVASLELDTSAPVDAAVGARGRVWFDALSLQRMPR